MTHDTKRDFAEPLDLSGLCGRTFVAFSQDDSYWHASVALQAIDGTSVIFTAVEHSAGHLFEVFPIQYVVETSPRDGTKEGLPAPMTIASAEPLWRVEWIESGAVGPALGSGTNTQYVGRGPAPLKAVSAARVLAGVLMESAAGQRLVIASSDSAPFNVEIGHAADAIDQMLEGFEPRAVI